MITNDSRRSIIINSINPEDDKKKIILALIASIRWYSDYLFKGHNDISDENDLFNIAQLLEYVCNTVITAGSKQKKQIVIYIGEGYEESKERLMSGLIGATRWYANSDDSAKYNTDEVDAQNLSTITVLQQSFIKAF